MTISVYHVERYQADCDRCGWHTREAEGGDGMRWANSMAHQHATPSEDQ